MPSRNFFTWEAQLDSDRQELHGFDNELVAVLDLIGDWWTVKLANDDMVGSYPNRVMAVNAAQNLLRSAR